VGHNKTENIQRCAEHFMSFHAFYPDEGSARWEGEIMYADWKNHFPDFQINLEIRKTNQGDWEVLLTAEKAECTYAEH